MPEEPCDKATGFITVHVWAVREEDWGGGGKQKDIVTAVRCVWCDRLAPAPIAGREVEKKRLADKANKVAANIRRDSDDFRKLNKKKG